jgi:hypothetical protein
MKQRISIIAALLLFLISTGADTTDTTNNVSPVYVETVDTTGICIKCYNDSIEQIIERMHRDVAAFEKISRRIVRNTSNISDNNSMIHGILNNCGSDTVQVQEVDTSKTKYNINAQKKGKP